MERLLPSNVEAEAGVLGSIIIDPDAVALVSEFLAADDFYRDAHRTIYETILCLTDQHTSADFVTICDSLERQGKLEDVGGASYVTSLINQVPTSGNVVYYGQIVLHTALLRRLIHVAGQIASEAYTSEQDAAQTLESAEQLIFSISQRFGNATLSESHVRDLLATYLSRLDQMEGQRGGLTGFPTGFVDLDRLTGGFQRSDLIVMAGRPGMGKSSVALSIAHSAAKHSQRKIGIFSLEMSKDQLIQRLLAIESGVNQQRLRSGWIEDDEWEHIVAAISPINEMDIWIDDTPSISTIQLRSKARRWALEHGVDLIIVDYLQLMVASSSERQRQKNREQEVSDIAKALKGLARELNIPVLALAQLSRAVESRASKVPQLSDLRESGAIENDADIVLFIYRDDVYNPDSERPNTADIIVAKHRNGPLGEVCVAFDKSQTRFRDIMIGLPTVEQHTTIQRDDDIEIE